MDEALKTVVDRRNQRLEELLDEYEEEPAVQGFRASRGIVIPTGSVMARVMFVGFSPSPFEDTAGVAFDGQIGEVLDDLLAYIGMKRQEVYLTHVIKYRLDGDGERLSTIVNTSMKYLRKEIAIVKPLVLVTLGTDVLKQFEPTKRLSVCHGTIIDKRTLNRSVVPMHHPASCLRDKEKRKELVHDIQAVSRALKGYEV
jgi:DNA polymerase